MSNNPESLQNTDGLYPKRGFSIFIVQGSYLSHLRIFLNILIDAKIEES